MYHAYQYFNREMNFSEKELLGQVWAGCPEEYADRKCYLGNIFPWMFMGSLVHTSTVLLRRERQKQVGGFDVSLKKSGEDYDFHLRTCRFGDVAYIDASSIHYRVGAPDQLSAPEYMAWVARNNLKTVRSAFENHNDRINLPKKLIQKRFADSYAWVGVEEFFENKTSARLHLGKSLKYHLFQKRILLLYFLSFLPKNFLVLIRDIKQFVLH
jgi:GT2 family glycosyltransferase